MLVTSNYIIRKMQEKTVIHIPKQGWLIFTFI